LTFIEFNVVEAELTYRQRANHYIALIFGILMLFISINLRDSNLNATNLYTNIEAGISAAYPRNWLIDTSGNYIFRVRDITRIGFKTTIQVSVYPVGSGTSTRSILDALTLNRSQVLAAYNVLSIADSFLLPDETLATTMNYTYANTEKDPFLESIPTVVQGIDVLAIKRGQAIIITFLADATTYQQDYLVFQRFLNELEF